MAYRSAARRWHLGIVGTFLGAAGTGSLIGLAWAWQSVTESATIAARGQFSQVTLLGHNWMLSPETRLLLLVAFSAAVGSHIHAITSFVTYVGNRSYRSSWFA